MTFQTPPDPAAKYAPHTSMSLFEEYSDLNLAANQSLSRLRHLVEGMAPSYNKAMCQKALKEIHERLKEDGARI